MNSQPKIYGIKATMNIWRPEIEGLKEFNLGQLWLVTGSYESHDLNRIEVGWQVYPHLYFDHQPRFFIFWTRDAYNTTRCYNLRCYGFVQISNTVVIEGAFSFTSVFGGPQTEFTIKIWKDENLGSWWLGIILDNGVLTPVGYWPSVIFGHLGDYAETVRWGGEITNKNSLRHTRTQMGSGYFPDGGFGRSAYMSHLEVAISENDFKPVHDLQVVASNPDYYHAGTSKNGALGTHFFFGGPQQLKPTHAIAVRHSFAPALLYFSLGLFLLV